MMLNLTKISVHHMDDMLFTVYASNPEEHPVGFAYAKFGTRNASCFASAKVGGRNIRLFLLPQISAGGTPDVFACADF